MALDKKRKPTISVIMPVYNGAKFLRDAVQSILDQTYPDFEFIVIDDGSTDNTEKIIKSYIDPRIHLLTHKKNQGIVFSLNEGIKASKGKYIARMDADDVSLKDRFYKQVNYLENNPTVGVLATNLQTIDSIGMTTTGPWWNQMKLPIVWYLMWENCIAHPTVMLRRNILNMGKQNIYRNIRLAEDYDLWLRLIPKTKFRMLDEILVKYRRHDKNNTIKNNNSSILVAAKYNKQFIDNLKINGEEYLHEYCSDFLTKHKKNIRYSYRATIKWQYDIAEKLIEQGYMNNSINRETLKRDIYDRSVRAVLKLSLVGKLKVLFQIVINADLQFLRSLLARLYFTYLNLSRNILSKRFNHA